jgi:hypothetical protein
MLLAEKFAEALEAKFNNPESKIQKQFPNTFTYTFFVEKGQKFDRIVETSHHSTGGHTSVHAFVERATGALIKPATYKAPAKLKSGWATKYNLLTEFDKTLEVADVHGGYLYQ